eukprot:6920896-Karenia_brevis.AAC.1
MCDQGLIINSFLDGVKFGAQTAEQLKAKYASGTFAMPFAAYTDSYSLFSWLCAKQYKIPVD